MEQINPNVCGTVSSSKGGSGGAPSSELEGGFQPRPRRGGSLQLATNYISRIPTRCSTDRMGRLDRDDHSNLPLPSKI